MKKLRDSCCWPCEIKRLRSPSSHPEGGRWSFKELCLTLAEACGTDMDVDTHRVELQTLPAETGRDIARELAHRVRRKVRDAYPEMPATAQESLATQHFKNALVVEKCRESVGLLAPRHIERGRNLCPARRESGQAEPAPGCTRLPPLCPSTGKLGRLWE